MGLLELTTTARVRALLEVGGKTWGSADPAIGQSITAVSAAIERYLGRELKSEARTRGFDLRPGQAIVWLPAYPIASVASVFNDATRVFAAATEIAATNFAVDDQLGSIEFDLYVPVAGPRVLRVTWTGGVGADAATAAAAYPDLSLACELQVAYLMQRRNSLGGTAQQAGGGSTTYSEPIALLPKVKELLAPHRRVRFG